jgi:hypothetical protein
MIARYSWSVAFGLFGLVTAARAAEYQTVYKTVYDEQEVTAYKIQEETVYEDRHVTKYRPVIDTETRERRVTVAKPVTEMCEREETYKVLRPVVETEERESRHIVRRPIVETFERDEVSYVNEPVTSYTTQMVDQGGYVNQQVVTPTPGHSGLRWVPAGTYVDPNTGASIQRWGGFARVTTPGQPVVTNHPVYQPHPVAVQVPQTQYVQRQVTRKVPMQVTRYEDEVVVDRTPVQITRMVEQELVRKVPVTRTHTEYSERVEKVPVQVERLEAYDATVQVPRIVEHKVPVTITRKVPRTIEMKVPVTCGCDGISRANYEEAIEVQPKASREINPSREPSRSKTFDEEAPKLEGSRQESRKPSLADPLPHPVDEDLPHSARGPSSIWHSIR